MASKKYVLQAAVLLLTGIQTLVSIFFTVKGLRAGDYINEVLGIVGLITVDCVFVGVQKNMLKLLIPNLCWILLQIIWFAIIAVIHILTLSGAFDVAIDDKQSYIITTVLSCIYVVFLAGAFMVHNNFFKLMEDEEEENRALAEQFDTK